MKLRSFIRILEHPQILVKYIQTKKKDEVRKALQIIEFRKKMNDSCILSDKLIEQKIPIPEIIEIVSKRIAITKYPIAWYCLVRKHKPELIVETGTSMGWSSFMILAALKQNDCGHLYSFDLDDSKSVQRDGGVGYLVSEQLKQNWTLIIGDTKKLLESVLKRSKQIDMFIHDSDHSYEMMMFEYNLVWPYLKKSGIFCSDDINHNDAFEEFTKKHNSQINNISTFQEIQRPSDDSHIRPFFGYFLKNNL